MFHFNTNILLDDVLQIIIILKNCTNKNNKIIQKFPIGVASKRQ